MKVTIWIKATKRKLEKGVEFLKMWLNWCAEFDKNIDSRLEDLEKGRNK